ncbi:MAG: amidohydrolase family protein [Chitinophagaceae bacterium]
MRIDAHQHFWMYHPEKHGWINDEMKLIRRNFTPSDLKPILDKHLIDGSIAVQADETLEETDFLLSLTANNDFIKGVVGWIDLKNPSIEDQLTKYKEYKKLLGFRCIMQGQPDELYLNNEIFINNVASLSIYKYTYDLLIYHHQLPSLLKFTEKLPDNRFILDHIGKPNIKEKNIKAWKENIIQLAKHPGIYCKLSGMITEADYNNWSYENIVPYMDVVAEAFGPSRLCFGSDWPVCLVAGNYDRMIEVVEKWTMQFTKEEYNQIFGLNACKFYNI